MEGVGIRERGKEWKGSEREIIFTLNHSLPLSPSLSLSLYIYKEREMEGVGTRERGK